MSKSFYLKYLTNQSKGISTLNSKMSKSFYLKYQQLSPVQINTHILNKNTFEWIQTISTVSELIMAAVSEPTKSLLGLPKDFGPLSLHSFEGEPLESDLNLSKLNTGLTAKDALIIKSLNDAQNKPFDPTSYKIDFPFFQPNGESFLTLQGRDAVVEEINLSVLPDPKHRSKKNYKYFPIVISTSRGMGKTFLLKMIGLQNVKPELKNAIIQEAGSCGRILSFDFVQKTTAIESVKDVRSFFPRLMIYFLCRIFQGTQVDGINFEFIEFQDIQKQNLNNKKLNDWKMKFVSYGADRVMEEYIRLTNIAFSIDKNSYCFTTPPVFLLDEVQTLCKLTDKESSRKNNDGTPQYHTLLSLLLKELAGNYQPICICTGTSSGGITSISDPCLIIPKWILGDEDLINCLVYASYQIPRLLSIAHDVWFKLRSNPSQYQNREFFLQLFEKKAKEYYQEMANILNTFSLEQISRIILSCSVHYSVKNVSEFVPGTDIQWSRIIQESIIFPYSGDCYLFPYTLVFNQTSGKAVEDHCRSLIRNLNLKDFFPSFDYICRLDLYNFGIFYESLFASSLAVKYYLLKLINPENRLVSFSQLYDFGEHEGQQKLLLNDYILDLSEGISLPLKEFVEDETLPCAVIHQKGIKNAHHDIILPTNLGNICVSCKSSFNFSKQKLDEQKHVSKKSKKVVKQLVLIYLGSLKKEKNYPDVAFLNGRGLCNGLSLDLLILVKKLKSKNNNQLK